MDFSTLNWTGIKHSCKIKEYELFFAEDIYTILKEWAEFCFNEDKKHKNNVYFIAHNGICVEKNLMNIWLKAAFNKTKNTLFLDLLKRMRIIDTMKMLQNFLPISIKRGRKSMPTMCNVLLKRVYKHRALSDCAVLLNVLIIKYGSYY